MDKRKLPEPDYQAQQVYVAPETDTERQLAAIWQQVLQLDPIGATANFFEIGGHSLLATQVVSQIAEQMRREVPIRAVFEHSTVRELAAHLDALAASDYRRIAPAPRDGALPLSFSQQRLWFIDQLEGGSTQYNMHTGLQLIGALDRDALQRALDRIVSRHEVLRTTFARVDGEGVQVIHPAQPLAIVHVDLSDLSEPEQTRRVEELQRDNALAPFDLSADLLLRCTLVRLRADAHVILLATHHIASDGWSMTVLAREFGALYDAFSRGAADPLPALPVQYADFAQWQRELLQGERLQAQLDYWRGALAGLPPVHGLLLDRPRPPRQSFAGAQVTRHLDTARLARLHDLARGHDASLFMLLHAALSVLVGRYSNEDDVVIGTPVAGRTHRDLEPLIGFFINSLVIRSDLSGAPSFVDVMQRTRRRALDAYAHQDVPFEMLVEDLRPGRTLAHTPLYQISFTFHNNEKSTLELPGLRLSGIASESLLARYDLEVHMAESDDGLHVRWVYATSLFDAASVERLADSFGVLVDALLDAPDAPVHELPLLSQAQRETLRACNDNAAGYERERCVHELFEARAAARPDAVAVVADGIALSYAQLNAEANRLAHYLIEQGVVPDTLVGLCVERSAETLIGILAILKAGGAYVPLDPNYPQDRIDYMLRDSGVELVLTQNTLLEDLPMLAERSVLPLDAAMRALYLAGQSDANIAPASRGLTAKHLAYAVYTSGSSGQPKGVLLEHQGLANLALAQRDFDIDADSRVLQFSSLSFDASTWDWLLALAHGAALYLCPQDVRESAQRLGDFLIDNAITHALIPPALLAHLDATRDYAFKVLVVGGEACEEALAWTWARKHRLVNAYGPSENTVVATCGDVTAGRPVTLGRALPNCSAHVVNAHDRLAPIGVPGELLIGGDSLARGYWQRDALTQQRFVTLHLDGAGEPERLYRSGDLVRRLADGTLQFLGRVDDQVKLRGFRIELGEIQNALLQEAHVAEAVVVAIGNDGDKRLVAYVVSDTDAATLDPGALIVALRSALKRRLPDYMVPAAFVVLPQLPMTANGKVDKAALPAPDLRPGSDYVAAATPTEAELVALWAALLDLDAGAISATANFFDLGGHSILAIRLIAQLGTQFGVQLSVRDMFHYPSLQELAAHIDTAGTAPVQATWNPLVTLSSDAALPALYVVPAAGLLASPYRPLAQALKGRRSVHVFEPAGMEGEGAPAASMSQIVQTNLRSLQQRQPHGPYVLAGHSFGGAVAFEMARALEARGEDVQLILLDSVLYLPDAQRAVHSADTFLRRLLADDGIDIPESDASRPLDPQRLQELLTLRLSAQGLLPDDAATRDGDTVARFVALFRAQSSIYGDYRPGGRFTGRAGLLLARDGEMAKLPTERLCSHLRACCAEFDIAGTVDGAHLSMLDGRHAAALAAAIGEFLVRETDTETS
ncbi:MAG TPA: amino acid adenylation domain-containing protein [Tahibacter sp.]|uniref:amino acid adenylation domain-containing protein n=1 Tax=Tahibacter sp. TaxID=2056211 RepID=UPI002C8346E1|nr:amino acid adenylation domain-containing protein [Tahibacter sp.]HSX59291.1 amino acid adenylation domain-containing protein [Tahibacter sp.]